MKVTVCQLHNDGERLAADWEGLVAHVREQGSELVVLPEMGLSPWLAATNKVNQAAWLAGVVAHEAWLGEENGRLSTLTSAIVLGSQPTVVNGKNQNQGFVWEAETGLCTIHTKYYLPNEGGFWEATWYERSVEKRFEPFVAGGVMMGMMLCTDMWFTEHARAYGRAGVDLLVCPRATPIETVDKWIAGGRTAAVVSGAFCLSSNHAGSYPGVNMAGAGWIIDPDGKVLGLTSEERPFLTLDIDLNHAKQAKNSYPRYVLE
ncbi:MAG: carbon-nitrogen hydrolase family protein [Chloroflexota bacterium]